MPGFFIFSFSRMDFTPLTRLSYGTLLWKTGKIIYEKMSPSIWDAFISDHWWPTNKIIYYIWMSLLIFGGFADPWLYIFSHMSRHACSINVMRDNPMLGSEDIIKQFIWWHHGLTGVQTYKWIQIKSYFWIWILKFKYLVLFQYFLKCWNNSNETVNLDPNGL